MIQIVKKTDKYTGQVWLHVKENDRIVQLFLEKNLDDAIKYAESLHLPEPPEEVVWEKKD